MPLNLNRNNITIREVASEPLIINKPQPESPLLAPGLGSVIKEHFKERFTGPRIGLLGIETPEEIARQKKVFYPDIPPEQVKETTIGLDVGGIAGFTKKIAPKVTKRITEMAEQAIKRDPDSFSMFKTMYSKGKPNRMLLDEIKPTQSGGDLFNETSQGYAEGRVVLNKMTENERPVNLGKVTNPDQLPPILIDKNNNIIDGNHRWAAAKIAGLDSINVIKVNEDFSKSTLKLTKPLPEEAILTKTLRGTKGLTDKDIMLKHPDIQLKREVPATDIYGNKVKIPEGEALTPYELKGNKVLLQDGQTYIVSKSQFQNIKGQSVVAGELKYTGKDRLTGKEFDMSEEVSRKPKFQKTEDADFNTYSQEYYRDFETKLKPQLLKSAKSTFDSKDVKVIDVDMSGSYKRGTPNPESDLDVKVYYEGKVSEDVLAERMETLWSSYGVHDVHLQRVEGKVVGKPFAPELQGLEESVRSKHWRETAGRIKPDPVTKFEQYQLPGGKNYKEILIKAPRIKAGMPGYIETGVNPIFKSSHYPEDPNLISHLRLNERTYKGKPVTFMEEAQSDWARSIRDWQEGNLVGEHGRGQATLGKFKPPSHPFVEGGKWVEPTVKRGLQEAVANNSDYFSWINGEQTSARYNLATHLEDVRWTPDINKLTENGKYAGVKGDKVIELTPKGDKSPILVGIDKKGTIVDTTSTGRNADAGWQGKKLDEVLGKGLADSIMSKESGTLSGEGLKFGGEWANNLYDKQIKNIVEDVTGGKVEVLDMGLPIQKTEQWFTKDFQFLYPKQLKVGKEVVKGEGRGESYIITDILGEGKFKAVPKQEYNLAPEIGIPDEYGRTREQYLVGRKQTFDISTKTTTQQGIRLTDEIKAKIRGEAPKIKTSGKMFGGSNAGTILGVGAGITGLSYGISIREQEPEVLQIKPR